MLIDADLVARCSWPTRSSRKARIVDKSGVTKYRVTNGRAKQEKEAKAAAPPRCSQLQPRAAAEAWLAR